MKKIKVRPITDIIECPFYTKNLDNRIVCLFKYTMAKTALMSLSENPVDFTDSEWRKDCEGKFCNCTVIPLFYEENDGNGHNVFDKSIDDYNPFITEEKDPSTVNVSIEHISNPYTYKTDILVYPTNLDMTIDDANLDIITNGKVQLECDKLSRPISIGSVYKTNSYGASAKYIYHAVVSGLSRLVTNEIKSAMLTALQMAEEEKYNTIAILPFDGGTLDINASAMMQLSAAKEFIDYGNIKHIKNIIFLMPEKESHEAFCEYYKRIFE